MGESRNSVARKLISVRNRGQEALFSNMVLIAKSIALGRATTASSDDGRCACDIKISCQPTIRARTQC